MPLSRSASCSPLSCRRAAASVIFAISIIPILGLCGLAVDYGLWARINSSLAIAANSAALNAVKVAANGELANDPNYLAHGVDAGSQWFKAEAGERLVNEAGLVGREATVSVVGTSSITATVTYSGTIPSIFGNLFRVTHYPIGGEAAATVGVALYTEVIVAMDNSSSMDIAALPPQINSQMALSACDASNAYYPVSFTGNVADPVINYGPDQSAEAYGNYTCGLSNGVTFDGSNSYLSPAGQPVPVACPAAVPAGALVPASNSAEFQIPTPLPSPAPGTKLAANSSTKLSGIAPVQQCKKLGLQTIANVANPALTTKAYPIPGPPCAFACHWQQTPKAGLGTDLWAEARRNGVELRFDLVKNATQATLAQMQQDNIPAYNNLSVGIYTFERKITQYYPDPTNCPPAPALCEAGNDFAAASKAVGYPPGAGDNASHLVDTGIQPVVAALQGDNDNTAFPEDMYSLYKNYVTASGTGLKKTSPQKFLILITDGFQDDPYIAQYTPNERRAFDPTNCQLFKNEGYQVYVLFTPYYPVVHYSYLQNNWAEVTQGGAGDPLSIAYNLQRCSSQYEADGVTPTPNTPAGYYYVSAADPNSVTAALKQFLAEILDAPARFIE